MKAKLKRLHPQDNIVVATGPIKAGSVLKLDKVKLQVVSNVPLAGKIATRPIAEGEKIIKLGQPIGHATMNIEPGEWVHTHNLASDYLPTPERVPEPGGGPLVVEADESPQAPPFFATPAEEAPPTEVVAPPSEQTPPSEPPSAMGAPAGDVPQEVPRGEETSLTQDQPGEATAAAVQELPPAEVMSPAEDTAAGQTTAPPEGKPPVAATTPVGEMPATPAGETLPIAETFAAQAAGPQMSPAPGEQIALGPETPSVSKTASTGEAVPESEPTPPSVQPSQESSSAAASKEDQPSRIDDGASSAASGPETGTS